MIPKEDYKVWTNFCLICSPYSLTEVKGLAQGAIGSSFGILC